MRIHVLRCLCLLMAVACVPFPIGNKQGICNVGNTEIDTFHLGGMWKGPEDSDGVFDMLYFEDGGIYFSADPGTTAFYNKKTHPVYLTSSLCRVKWNSSDDGTSHPFAPVNLGAYDIVNNDTQIAVQILDVDTTTGKVDPSQLGLTADVVDYHFQGSCEDTTLTLHGKLSQSGGVTTQTFTVYNTDAKVVQGVCRGASTTSDTSGE